MNIIKFHQLYILNTKAYSIIENSEMSICKLTFAVSKALDYEIQYKVPVYITSRMLKHIYDKRPAEEYDNILRILHKITKFPQNIYSNKDSKRGNYVFTKTIDGILWFCPIEKQNDRIYVVTCFKLRKEEYIGKYSLIWSWKGDMPSS